MMFRTASGSKLYNSVFSSTSTLGKASPKKRSQTLAFFSYVFLNFLMTFPTFHNFSGDGGYHWHDLAERVLRNHRTFHVVAWSLCIRRQVVPFFRYFFLLIAVDLPRYFDLTLPKLGLIKKQACKTSTSKPKRL